MGPVFEGMPLIRFSDKKISWSMISKDITNMFAPKLPYKYLNENKEKAYQERDFEEKLRRKLLK